MIEAKELTLIYHDGTIALDNINVLIPDGELVFITGPSGSGKTSFLKLLMGMEQGTQGSLIVAETDLGKMNGGELKRYRQSLGPVFQEFRLIEGRTALENILTGLRFLEKSQKNRKEEAMKALGEVGLFHKAGSLVENLSFGEAQRVAIARAMVRRPQLLLADEPTGNLDQENSIKILNLLTEFQKEKTTVIITTHAAHLLPEDKEYLHISMQEGKMTAERTLAKSRTA